MFRWLSDPFGVRARRLKREEAAHREQQDQELEMMRLRERAFRLEAERRTRAAAIRDAVEVPGIPEPPRRRPSPAPRSTPRSTPRPRPQVSRDDCDGPSDLRHQEIWDGDRHRTVWGGANYGTGVGYGTSPEPVRDEPRYSAPEPVSCDPPARDSSAETYSPPAPDGCG